MFFCSFCLLQDTPHVRKKFFSIRGQGDAASAETDIPFCGSARVRDDLSAALQFCRHGDRGAVPWDRCSGGSGRHIFPSFSDIGICAGSLCGVRYPCGAELWSRRSRRDAPVFLERNMAVRVPERRPRGRGDGADGDPSDSHEHAGRDLLHVGAVYRDPFHGDPGEHPLQLFCQCYAGDRRLTASVLFPSFLQHSKHRTGLRVDHVF